MEEGYHVAVAKEVGNKLRFPSKCAYCLAPTSLQYTTVKHDQLKGCKLKVPHCETHSKMIKYQKIPPYGALVLALIVAVPLGRYFHNNAVFGGRGSIGFNYLAAGFVGAIVWFAALALLSFLMLYFFVGPRSIDPDGAVRIVEVYSDGFVLLFQNGVYGAEFNLLNHATPIERPGT